MRAGVGLVCLASVASCGGGAGDDDATGADAGSPLPPAAAACTKSTGGTDYEVGPGQPYGSIGEVPWHALEPGDTVRVHARPEPYREKVLISRRGTESQPIRLCGVAGGDGRRPIIDGDGAVTSANMHFTSYLPLQDRAAATTNTARGPSGS
jgi:hypothetical protein